MRSHYRQACCESCSRSCERENRAGAVGMRFHCQNCSCDPCTRSGELKSRACVAGLRFCCQKTSRSLRTQCCEQENHASAAEVPFCSRTPFCISAWRAIGTHHEDGFESIPAPIRSVLFGLNKKDQDQNAAMMCFQDVFEALQYLGRPLYSNSASQTCTASSRMCAGR